MSDASGSFTLDTSQAVTASNALVNALGSISQSGIATFAAVEEAGTGLEALGEKVLGAVTATVTAASNIQQAQAQLTAQSYNFSESLSQNQAQSKGLTNQLISMATSIKQPISNIQQLAGSIAMMGYSGQQIPVMTKDFAEFGAVTGINAAVYGKSINQIAVQTHTGVGAMNSLLGSLYAVGKETSGGFPGILSMTDRMTSLQSVLGLNAQQFVALTAFSQNFDSRLRGGAFGAVSQFTELFRNAMGDKQSNQAFQFFKFLGDGSATAGKKMAEQQPVWDSLTKFLGNLAGQGAQGAFNALKSMGAANPQDISTFGELGHAGMGSLTKYMNDANAAWQSGTDVQTAYQAIASTTAAQITGMRDTIQQLANTVGQDLLPAMSAGAHLFGDFASAASAVPAPILAIGAGLLAIGGLSTVALGAITKVVGIWRGLGGLTRGIGAGATGAGKEEEAAGTTAATEAENVNTGSISENTAALAANTEAIMANLAAIEARSGASIAQGVGFAYEGGIAGVGKVAPAAEEAATSTAEVGTAVAGAGAAMEGGEVAATGLVASLGGIGGVAAGAAGGIGVLIGALAAGGLLEQSFANNANKIVGAFSKNIDTTSIDGIQKGIAAANTQVDVLKNKTKGSLVAQTFSWSNISSFGGAHDTAVKEIKDYKNEASTLQGTLSAATSIAQNFWQTASPSNDQINQVLSAASANLIDIAHGGQQAASSVESLLSTNLTQQASQNQQAFDTMGQAAMGVATQEEALAQSTDQLKEAQLQEGVAARQLANYQYTLANAQNQVAEAQLGTQQASLNTQQAQLQEQQAAMQLAHAAVYLADAQAKVTDAELQTQSATIALFEAQLKMSEAATEQQLGLESATVAAAQAQTQQASAITGLSAAQFNLFKLGADYANQYKQALNQVADTTLSLQSAQISAANAQWQLTYLQEEGASQRDIQLAQLTLAQANQQVTDTQTSLTSAQQQANQMPTDHAISLAQAQNQLQSAQENVTSSAIQEQQAQITLSNTQAEAADNTTIKQAQITLSQAQDKVTESETATTQAQITLNQLQNGSIQLQYQTAALNVQQAQLKQKDSAYAVITAQMNLNTLQDGSVQLSYKRAQDQVTAAIWAQDQASVQLAADQATLGGNENDAYTQARNLANVLLKSGNPQLHQMGQELANSLPTLAGYAATQGSLAGQLASVGTNGQSAAGAINSISSALAAGIPVLTTWNSLQPPTTSVYMPGRGLVDPALAPKAAAGMVLTRPTFLMAGEAGPEVVLPLNDTQRSLQLLQQAGVLDSYGMPTAGYQGSVTNTGTTTATHTTSSSTTNIFNLQAMTQPASPEEIMDAFAWQQRLVGV